MLSVALTGNIGAGKSTVAELFRRWGATILDADQIVRELQGPGQPVLAQIIERFGNQVIRDDGTLNRAALRSRVLADPDALADLNRIIHPAVQRRRLQLLAESRRRGDRIVVSDIPLLFESGNPAEFDAIVLVDAPEPVRRARLLATRSLTTDEVENLMSAQLSSSTKRARSDFVIQNDGDLEDLERAAAAVWDTLVARA